MSIPMSVSVKSTELSDIENIGQIDGIFFSVSAIASLAAVDLFQISAEVVRLQQ